MILVDDDLLEETQSTKFLGMILDRGLNWDDHIDSRSKVTSGIYFLHNLSKFCLQDVLKMAYYPLIYPHLTYSIRLWGSCSKQRYERVFRLQNMVVRIIAKLEYRESCRNSFRELSLLTLASLYILEVRIYCRSKIMLVWGSDIHEYKTRGRDNCRINQHRTAKFETLPSQMGIKLINELPNVISQQITKNSNSN